MKKGLENINEKYEFQLLDQKLIIKNGDSFKAEFVLPEKTEFVPWF